MSLTPHKLKRIKYVPNRPRNRPRRSETLTTAELTTFLREQIQPETCLNITLTNPLSREATPWLKLNARPVSLKSGEVFQWTYRGIREESHVNRTAAETAFEVSHHLTQHDHIYREAHLQTIQADFRLRRLSAEEVEVRRQKPSRTKAAPKTHNRRKSYLIPEGTTVPFLVELGVMTPKGRVKEAKYDKFRQINRFLEMVNDIVSELPAEGKLRIVDYGCGKSYLTFAMHHLFHTIHRRNVDIIGLDLRDDVIETCTQLTRKLSFPGLTFRVGEIADFTDQLPEDASPIHLVISLHACDTATDDALFQAIRHQVPVILSVPCCQHEIAAQVDSAALAPVLTHGILKERFSAIATDSMRALLLQANGYRTQVIEFIDLDHTAKNLMIRAVRAPVDAGFSQKALSEYDQLKQLLGIKQFSLESRLQEISSSPANDDS